MQILGPASVEAMVAEFLRAEISSSRFGGILREAMARHGAATDLVTHPDLRDPKANALRAQILAEVRGFPDREVFTGVPVDTVRRWSWSP